jgi:hypothetical protein
MAPGFANTFADGGEGGIDSYYAGVVRSCSNFVPLANFALDFAVERSIGWCCDAGPEEPLAAWPDAGLVVVAAPGGPTLEPEGGKS